MQIDPAQIPAPAKSLQQKKAAIMAKNCARTAMINEALFFPSEARGGEMEAYIRAAWEAIQSAF